MSPSAYEATPVILCRLTFSHNRCQYHRHDGYFICRYDQFSNCRCCFLTKARGITQGRTKVKERARTGARDRTVAALCLTVFDGPSQVLGHGRTSAMICTNLDVAIDVWVCNLAVHRIYPTERFAFVAPAGDTSNLLILFIARHVTKAISVGAAKRAHLSPSCVGFLLESEYRSTERKESCGEIRIVQRQMIWGPFKLPGLG